MNRRFAIVLLVPLLSAVAHLQTPAGDVLTRSTLTPDERVVALSVLWREAAVSFAYFDAIADRWNQVYRQFIPRVRAAPSDYEYYLELMRFYSHLADGHSGVFWPPAFDDALGYPPLEIRKVDGRAVVFRIMKSTEEVARVGIRPGLAILEVDGRPIGEVVDYWRALKRASTAQATDRLAYFRILTGRRGSDVRMLVEQPDGARRTVQLARSERYFNDTNLDPASPFVARVDGAVGVFQANQMSTEVADGFAAYIEQHAAQLSGLVLDLRYNGGGSDLAAFAMIRRLTEAPLDGPIYEVTSYRADRRALRQEQEVVRTSAGKISPAAGRRFTGWLVVAIGEQTHSATESGFLAVVRARPQTVFVGSPTAGSTGQPMIFPLPGGGLGAVCSRRTLLPDGSRFVGVGFQPDVRIETTREDLWQGRDRVLDNAIQSVRDRMAR